MTGAEPVTGARSGVLAVDKPTGPTSHDVVARVRRAFGTRRVGHTGTLDPFASGLLLVCTGVATRLAEYLSGLPKTYLATGRLGETTTTGDPEGEVIDRSDAWRSIVPDRFATELERWRGTVLQRPPAFSAKKVDGQRAYAMARAGERVELTPVPVEIHTLELVEWAPPEFALRVRCGSGTYIRALARDIGAGLGVGAHLRALRREGVGSFSVEDAIPLAELEAGHPQRGWLEPAEAVGHLPAHQLPDEALAELRHGRRIPVDPGAFPVGETIALLHSGVLAAIGEVKDGGIQPRKVLL